MDIVTHGVTGLLIARAATNDTWRTGTAAVVVGSLAPDLDVVARLWDPLASLTVHRVPTHSFLGGLVLALVAAGLIRWFRGGGLWRLAVLAYLGVLSHLVLDLFTPFGTVPLWPLNSRRWAVASLYMVDPTVVLVGLAGIISSVWWRQHGMRVARAGLLVLLAYLLLGTGVMRGVEARWAEALDHQGLSTTRQALVPAFPGPLRWVGLGETAQGIIRSRFWAWRVTVSTATWFRKETPEPGTPDVEAHQAVQAFLKFARFPWRTTVADGKGWIIEYQELAFVDHPLGGPMVLRLRLDPSGVVKAFEFDHRL